MHLFYAPDIQTPEHTLSLQESTHCIRVLRLQKSDTVFLADGKETLCTGEIIDPDPRGCRIRITDKQENYGSRPYHLHVAVAPPKNMERFEWFVEKATEVGVDMITPLICEHSERRHCNTERSERIAIAAMKQCKRAQMPVINQAVPFAGFLRSRVLQETSAAIACVWTDQRRIPVKEWIQKAGNNILFLIGPEGDFSPREIREAIDAGCAPIDLGESVLRTETAALSTVFLAAYK
ncbi:MAG TPA: RsmE family RNA methyltransferase [Bacteroidales bacterium]|nr:MAG: Ribosomal RNA small subunit methyltransferase E [Bacteroidetes bacterium ADurb.Bin037]HPV87777.1 RsmE family RNA methyltransferase [Bacteroidales bacterium]HPW78559.1 RsmE family RNA methyltransferase [Bacteroidales bacterium]HQB55770.1 RsmE family RNA methyltransferase [Bacteroidales bacterium]